MALLPGVCQTVLKAPRAWGKWLSGLLRQKCNYSWQEPDSVCHLAYSILMVGLWGSVGWTGGLARIEGKTHGVSDGHHWRVLTHLRLGQRFTFQDDWPPDANSQDNANGRSRKPMNVLERPGQSPDFHHIKYVETWISWWIDAPLICPKQCVQEGV